MIYWENFFGWQDVFDFTAPREARISHEESIIAIRLQDNLATIIDADDWAGVRSYAWRAVVSSLRPQTYVCDDNQGRRIYLHQLILGVEQGKVTDHINGCQLDNRKCNLRLVSVRQNLQNRRQRKKKYKGVFPQGGNKYLACIVCEGKEHKRHGFQFAFEAAMAYDEMARDLNLVGHNYSLNFPLYPGEVDTDTGYVVDQ